MKFQKFLSAILSSSMLFSFAAPAAAHYDAACIGNVPKLPKNTTITLDGKMDEAVWADSLKVDINQLHTGTETGTYGVAYMLWDDNAWYIYYDVIDAEIVPPSENMQQQSPWITESVEMFFDFGNEYTDLVQQFRIDVDGWLSYYTEGAETSIYGPEAAQYMGNYAVSLDAYGYNVEVAVNLDLWGMSEGDAIGLQLQINDMTAANESFTTATYQMNQSLSAGSWDAALYDYVVLGPSIVNTCTHENHANDTWKSCNYRNIDDANVHERQDVYSHSCTDCGEPLPDIYSEWIPEDHLWDGNSCSLCGFSKITEPDETTISYFAAYGTPRIDGTVDDIWDSVEWTSLEQKDHYYSNGEIYYIDLENPDLTTTAKVKILNDDNYVYFLAEIFDETLSIDDNVANTDYFTVKIHEDACDDDSGWSCNRVHDNIIYSDGSVEGIHYGLSNTCTIEEHCIRLVDDSTYVVECSMSYLGGITPTYFDHSTLKMEYNDNDNGSLMWNLDTGYSFEYAPLYFSSNSSTCEHLNHDNDTWKSCSYRNIDDPDIHERQDVYSHSCTDCGEPLPDIYSEWIPEEHLWDGNTCSQCGYVKVEEVCEHKNLNPDTWKSCSYRNIDDPAVHERQDIYARSCADCGETLPDVYSDWMTEEHNYVFIDYVQNSGIWENLGDGTHIRREVKGNYQCSACGDSKVDIVDETGVPEAHRTYQSESNRSVSALNPKDAQYQTKHAVDADIHIYCNANGCDYHDVSDTYYYEDHRFASNGYCTCGVFDEIIRYRYLLSEVVDMEDISKSEYYDDILDMISNEIIESGISPTIASDVIEKIKGAPERYRDIFIFSFYEYDMSPALEGMTISQYQPLENTMYLTSDASIADFFHESAHANDNNSGNPTTSDQDLYKKLEADVSLLIGQRIDKLNPSTGGISEILPNEKNNMIQNILGAQNEETKIRNSQGQIIISIKEPSFIREYEDNLKRSWVKGVYYAVVKELISELEHLPSLRINAMYSDVIGGMTNNTLLGDYGHSYILNPQQQRYYWFDINGNPTGLQSKEAWANFYASKFVDDIDHDKYEYLETACEWMNDTLSKDILEYYKAKYQ